MDLLFLSVIFVQKMLLLQVMLLLKFDSLKKRHYTRSQIIYCNQRILEIQFLISSQTLLLLSFMSCQEQQSEHPHVHGIPPPIGLECLVSMEDISIENGNYGKKNYIYCLVCSL